MLRALGADETWAILCSSRQQVSVLMHAMSKLFLSAAVFTDAEVQVREYPHNLRCEVVCGGHQATFLFVLKETPRALAGQRIDGIINLAGDVPPDVLTHLEGRLPPDRVARVQA